MPDPQTTRPLTVEPSLPVTYSAPGHEGLRGVRAAVGQAHDCGAKGSTSCLP
jgi:hypothetical protein